VWSFTIQSFWGPFGWMNVVLPELVTNLLTWMALFSLLSAAHGWLQTRELGSIRKRQHVVLWMNVLFMTAGYLFFNFSTARTFAVSGAVFIRDINSIRITSIVRPTPRGQLAQHSS
jgi:hypothetical protein